MPPKKVYIDVYIESIDPLKFYAEPSPFPLNDPPLLTGTNGIIFENDHHSGFDIFLQLQGNTFGYYFPPKEKDALWSQLGTKCPDKEVSDVLNPIKVLDPSPPIPPSRRTVLWAKNPNPQTANGKGQGPFKYTLRLINSKGEWLPLDPGGDNMNGPISRYFDWSAALIGIGSALATTALIAAGLYLAGFELVSRF